MVQQKNLFGKQQYVSLAKKRPRRPHGPLFPLPDGYMGIIEKKFWEFHNSNPEVYRLLVRYAHEWRDARGINARIGMKALFERVRWEIGLRKREHHDGDKEFKLNNNYTAFYARFIMFNYPELKGMFALRKQRIPATIGPKNESLPPDRQVL
ncbi:MAG: hypothetical protein PHI12_06590 [Dehalococcoidales bacterium]|nr:hypothetical protein [Dehalococcoidales bacterium]